MTQEEKDALLQYEEIKLSIKKLEEEADKLKPIISPLINAGEKLLGLHGSFEIKSRPKWTFSLDVQEEEKKLESLKVEEIAKGVAKNTPITYFEYRVTKTKKEEE